MTNNPMGKLTTTETIFTGGNRNEQCEEQISTPPPVTTKMKIKTQLDVICLFHYMGKNFKILGQAKSYQRCEE